MAIGGAHPERDAIVGLKARVDLVELAGQHTTLKRQGRVWWGAARSTMSARRASR